jgi:hypothetical protein
MVNVEIHSLYWDNSECLLEHNKKVMDYFNIPVLYHHLNGAGHGDWIDWVMENSTADVVGILDIDCVPLNKEIVDFSIQYAYKNKSFIGLAQCANHIFPYSHICGAAVFYFINRQFWIDLGKPSFRETQRGDVSEEISYLAEERKIPYKALYPTYFEREPIEGVWRLGNYGYFGIGTVFSNSVYHLYQGRYQQNIDLFAKRCQEIVDGTFKTDGMFSSTDEYTGKICR